MRIFINFSNHPSDNWSTKQKAAVSDLYDSEILDVPFPAVNAAADESEIERLAIKCVEVICEYHPVAVLCQGEFGVTYHVVRLLKKNGIRAVYACSERRTIEKKTDEGTVKTSEFHFVRFREY